MKVLNQTSKMNVAIVTIDEDKQFIKVHQLKINSENTKINISNAPL